MLGKGVLNFIVFDMFSLFAFFALLIFHTATFGFPFSAFLSAVLCPASQNTDTQSMFMLADAQSSRVPDH